MSTPSYFRNSLSEQSAMKLCFFIASFSTRSQLIEEFVWRFKRSPLNDPLFIFCDGAPTFCVPKGVYWRSDAWSFQPRHRPTAVTYRTLLRLACRLRKRARPFSNNLLGYTPLWGHRLKAAIRYLKEQGFTHAVWSCDDGWYEDFSMSRFAHIVQEVEKLNPGNFRLTESLTQSGHHIDHRKLADDVIELLPYSDQLPCHYITHQTSLWSLEVLDAITRPFDCACRHENSGAFRFHRGGWKAMEYEGEAVIPSLGVYGDDGFRSDQASS